ncbi:hypothetical protein C0584_05915 [Candidatus Parcubacteria bacterium]|nr:MAG: hypothetical protein C0584_05915 [Candidatus Parcubacteria bacterium]
MDIDLAVCDIEGCLTINKKQPIDTGILTKVHAYCELARVGETAPLVLCTGRPQPYAEAIIQTLDAFFPLFPSVVENGCFLYFPVDDIVLPNPAIIGREKEFRNIRTLLDQTIVANHQAKVEPGKEFCISLNPLGGLNPSELQKIIEKTLPDNLKQMIFIVHSSSAVDITPVGVDKASGLKFLSEKTGIKPEKMLGIGDTAGDFPMLSLVGHPACPANASDDVIQLVKDRSGYVASTPNTAGVWEILLQHKLIK